MKYADLGRDSEFEELARRIYLRDPASQLYENVARNRLLEKYNEITESFVAERFDEMNLRIREFEELDRNYRQNNLRLPLQEFYLDFEDYRYAANRMNEYRVLVADLTRTLNDIDQNFINASPDALIRINALTRWQENLSGGDNRLEGIVDRANSYRDNIVGIIQRVREFEQSLDIELNTRSLFVIAKTYEHTANVIEVQLDKFLNVSNQIVELRRFDESEYQSIARFINDSYKVPYATFLRSESAAWYDLLVVNFVHNLNHNDKYTEAAKNRLQEWGLLKERVSLYSDGDWLVTLANDINDLQILDWSNALVKTDVDRLKEISGMLHTQAQPIALPDEYAINIEEDPVVDGNQREENALFLRKFSLTGEVLDARLSLASYDDSTVWINGRSFVMETDVLYDARDNIFYAHTISISPDSFTEGENTILITTPDNPQLPLILFNLDLTVRVK